MPGPARDGFIPRFLLSNQWPASHHVFRATTLPACLQLYLRLRTASSGGVSFLGSETSVCTMSSCWPRGSRAAVLAFLLVGGAGLHSSRVLILRRSGDNGFGSWFGFWLAVDDWHRVTEPIGTCYGARCGRDSASLGVLRRSRSICNNLT